MYERIEFGPVPQNEHSEPLGSNYDTLLARRECELFIEAIRLLCGNEPNGAKLAISVEMKESNEYRQVVLKFDPDNEEANAYAAQVEAMLPENWPLEIQPRVDAMYRVYGPEEGV